MLYSRDVRTTGTPDAGFLITSPSIRSRYSHTPVESTEKPAGIRRSIGQSGMSDFVVLGDLASPCGADILSVDEDST